MVKIYQDDFNQTGVAVMRDFKSMKLVTVPLYDNDIVFETRRLLENPSSNFKECYALYGCTANSKYFFNLNVLLFQIQRLKRRYGVLPSSNMKDLRAGVMGLEKELNVVHNYLYC